MDRINIGAIEIRVDERRVLVDGQPVSLGSRAFDLLLAMAERRDRVATKDELLDAAWPGLVVGENNLTVQVRAIRLALGPGMVATVPGRGYRLTGVDNTASVSPLVGNLPPVLPRLFGRTGTRPAAFALVAPRFPTWWRVAWASAGIPAAVGRWSNWPTHCVRARPCWC